MFTSFSYYNEYKGNFTWVFSEFSIILTQMVLLFFLFRFCDATKILETKESCYVTGNFSFYESLSDETHDKESNQPEMNVAFYKPYA
jgi:hypothetical protein